LLSLQCDDDDVAGGAAPLEVGERLEGSAKSEGLADDWAEVASVSDGHSSKVSVRP
jgi:hypothetical protein